MSLQVQVEIIQKPSQRLFDILNDQYDYSASDLKWLRKHLHLSIKQKSYIDYVDRFARHNRITLLHALDNVVSILESANVKHWLVGEALRDAVQFGRVMPSTVYAGIGVLASQFQQLLSHIQLIQSDTTHAGHAGWQFTYLGPRVKLVAVQHRNYQGVQNPIVFIYAYDEQDDLYSYNYNIQSAFTSSELFPLRKTKIDHMQVNIPNHPYQSLDDQFPFWREAFLLKHLDKAVIILLQSAVLRNRMLYEEIARHAVKKQKFKFNRKFLTEY